MSCVSVIGSRDAIAVCSKRSPDGGVGSSRGIPSALVVASHIRRLRRSTSAPRTKKLTGAGALVGFPRGRCPSRGGGSGRCHVELEQTVSGPAPRIRTEDGVTVIPVLAKQRTNASYGGARWHAPRG